MGRVTAMAGRMNNIDQKFEFLAEKYRQSIQILFSVILAVSCTPSTLLNGYKWGW